MEVVLAPTTFWLSQGDDDGDPATYPGVACLESGGEVYICRVEDANQDEGEITVERVTSCVEVRCTFTEGDDADGDEEEEDDSDDDGPEPDGGEPMEVPEEDVAA